MNRFVNITAKLKWIGYAYDFIMVDESGKTCSGSGKQLPDYYCYGKEILAPADGEVVRLADGHPESKVYGDGRVECRADYIVKGQSLENRLL